jgi:PKD repeat protein
VSILGTVPAPDFSITGHCAGANISLADSSISPDGTITIREWIYDDAVFDTGEQASISFDSAGNYDITLQIYTDVGCHNTLTQTVEVHPLPVPDFAPVIGCEGNAIFFDNLSTIESNEIAFTRWQFFDGDDYHASGTAGAIHTYDSDGTYNVTMEAVSDWDCADQITQEVEIKPSPEADFAHSAACSGEPVFFSSQSSSSEPWNPVINVLWDFGDSTTSTSTSPEHAYDNAGLYDMEMVAISLNGCTDTMHYTLDVHHIPEAVATNLNACVATPHVLTDSSVAGGDSIILWNWQVDTLELSGQHPEIVMQDTGTYALQLRVATEHGCIDEIDTLLYVWENPVADFSMPADWGEMPLEMELENTSGGATAYHWDFGDSTTSANINPVHTWQNSGRYDIQLVAVSDKGCTDTTVKNLQVIVPLVDVGIINVRTAMDGSYLWVEADIINAGTMPVENLGLELRTSDGYLFREYLDHEFESGAVETYTFTSQPFIADGNLPDFTCVYLYPGTEDDVPENNEYCAINKPDFIMYSLYPNPVSGTLNITLFMPAKGDIKIEVFNATGRLVLDKTLNVVSGYRILTLDCAVFSSGKYTLRVSCEGDVEINSFVVE